jgi:V/A-type H+-transporting ATPase subunit D
METANPTRMNLLILKAQAEVARRGLDLLRSKREALVREFFNTMDQVLTTRDTLRSGLEAAMNALSIALGLDGQAAVESAAMAASRDLPVELTWKNVWGVRFPEIEHPAVVRSSDARGYALPGVSSHTNTAARRFETSLDLILKTLAVETRLKRIGAEIKKTTRRINALTEIVLPELQRRMRAIRFALEEREREDLFRMKRFKERSAADETA